MKLEHLTEAKHMGQYVLSLNFTIFDPKTKDFPYWSQQYNRFYSDGRSPKASATFDTKEDTEQYLNHYKSLLKRREDDPNTNLSTYQGWDLVEEASRFIVVEIKQVITQV